MSRFKISSLTDLLSQINSHIYSLQGNEQDTNYYLYVMKPKVKNNEPSNSTGLIVGIVLCSLAFIVIIVIIIIYVLPKILTKPLDSSSDKSKESMEEVEAEDKNM